MTERVLGVFSFFIFFPLQVTQVWGLRKTSQQLLLQESCIALFGLFLLGPSCEIIVKGGKKKRKIWSYYHGKSSIKFLVLMDLEMFIFNPHFDCKYYSYQIYVNDSLNYEWFES